LADIPGNKTTTAVVTVGSTTNGTLESVSDHDWYKITLSAGQAITVTINGVTLEDPFLNIYDSTGNNVLYTNDDINPGIERDSRLSFSANYSGVYYIDVGSFEDSYSGTFQLAITTYTPPPLATVDQIATQLTSGYWGGATQHFNVTQGGTIDVNVSGLTAEGKTLARAALDLWSDVIGVTFHEVTSGGQILFDDSQAGAYTSSNTTGGFIDWSSVNISTQWLIDNGTTLDSYSLRLNGRPWTPVMGEIHYSRLPANEWREELLRMKAGGIDIVSTYVFWIHHEEIEEQFDWTDRTSANCVMI